MTAAAARSIDVKFANRQCSRTVRLSALRLVVTALLEELPEIDTAELGIVLVGAREMERVNEKFLQHSGSTDVITFDYSAISTGNRKAPLRLHGDIFICVDEAVRQARRFRTAWPAEMVRYFVHGVLHLVGYDDHSVANRRKMKREENRLLRKLAARFPLSQLAGKPKLAA